MNSYSANHHLTELIINNGIHQSSVNMGHCLPPSLVVFHHHWSLFIAFSDDPYYHQPLSTIVSGYPLPTPATVVTIRHHHWHTPRGWSAIHRVDDKYK